MLEGRSILITGAASGIGAAAASVFSGYGAMLTLIDRDDAGARNVAERLPNAIALAADVRNFDDMRRAVAAAQAQFGALHGAFNNAGVEQAGGAMTPLAEIDPEDFDRVIAVNLKGAYVSMRAEIPALLAVGGGAIVNTASVMGWLGAPGLGAYTASKHGVVGLTRTVALELAPHGVRVNAVLPGAVATPMLIERGFVANPEFAKMAPTMHPLGRIARPEEIAEAAAWLLSSRASFVTGHTLAVDGGLSAA